MKIAFCIPGKNFSQYFLEDWTKLIKEMSQYDIEWKLFTGYNPQVHMVRAVLLWEGVKWKPDYFMWIDSDMACFRWEHVLALIKHNKDIVSGIYLTKDNKNTQNTDDVYEFACVKEGNTMLTSKDISNKSLYNGNLIPVKGNGMGWMLIKSNVFKNIKQPFMPSYNYAPGDGTNYISEDIMFQIVQLVRLVLHLLSDIMILEGEVGSIRIGLVVDPILVLFLN